MEQAGHPVEAAVPVDVHHVNPNIIGAVRRGPQGHGVVRVDNAGDADWLMLGSINADRARYTDEQVAEWPIVGAVPGTPSSWIAGEPLPDDEDDDRD